MRPVVLALGLLCCTSSAVGAPVYPMITADRDSQRVGSFDVRKDPTLRGAMRAFGRLTSCRLTSSISSVATWDRLGLRISFATFGGIPPGRTACTYRGIHVSWIRASGARWRTGLGLHPGDPVAELRRLYPRARFLRRPIGSWPAPAYWLVHHRERCVIGVCPRPYHQVPKLTATVRDGVVRSLFLPVGAQGD
jgi:hypothetical protein